MRNEAIAFGVAALAVAVACGVALWRWNTGVHILVLACGAVGAAWSLFG